MLVYGRGSFVSDVKQGVDIHIVSEKKWGFHRIWVPSFLFNESLYQNFHGTQGCDFNSTFQFYILKTFNLL